MKHKHLIGWIIGYFIVAGTLINSSNTFLDRLIWGIIGVVGAIIFAILDKIKEKQQCN